MRGRAEDLNASQPAGLSTAGPLNFKLEFKFGEEMPNYCDCTLTITGPNRQAVLEKIKGDPHEGKAVYFDVQTVVPMPEGLGDKWQEWAYENWGCPCVYPDRQSLNPVVKDENGEIIWSFVRDNADVILFDTPWNPPLYAIQALSAMFAENTFTLEDSGTDLPTGGFHLGSRWHLPTCIVQMLGCFCAPHHRQWAERYVLLAHSP